MIIVLFIEGIGVNKKTEIFPLVIAVKKTTIGKKNTALFVYIKGRGKADSYSFRFEDHQLSRTGKQTNRHAYKAPAE